ncbi:Chitotriosidase-1 [Drechslerella dactyloides]|uniref:chitinase n=1 Tax=Drechslerella dactyloides TaxID=74499 RepID=A0AAD6NMZ1_DREDA|nr:Chitotriosidase-1 [Drechslerella dactyloides]
MYSIFSILLAVLPFVSGAAIPVNEQLYRNVVVTVTERQYGPSGTNGTATAGGPVATPSDRAPPMYKPPSNTTKGDGFTGYRSIGYLVDWGIYGRKFFPPMLRADQFTHIMLSFLNFNVTTGEVFMTDPAADVQVKFGTAGLEWPTPDPKVANGIVEQMFLMKHQYRNLKTMLSIGGWTYSSEGKYNKYLKTPESRAGFAKTAAKFVNDFGMDGIDVDWEYPDTPEDGLNLADLLRRCREELNKLDPKFELSIAAPCGPKNIVNLPIMEIDKHLDFWNLMAYDFAGSGFSEFAGHMSNFYPSTDDPKSTPFSYVAALDTYLAAGVNPRKINTGMPIYGRSFGGTDGLGKSFSVDQTPKGWEPGAHDYKSLPLHAGDVVFEDEKLLASGSYNPETRVLVSYDTPKMARLKAQFIMDRGLGGAFWWETSADRDTAESNLVQNVIKTFGGQKSFQQKENRLDYPESKYDNIKSWSGESVKWNRTEFEQI